MEFYFIVAGIGLPSLGVVGRGSSGIRRQLSSDGVRKSLKTPIVSEIPFFPFDSSGPTHHKGVAPASPTPRYSTAQVRNSYQLISRVSCQLVFAWCLLFLIWQAFDLRHCELLLLLFCGSLISCSPQWRNERSSFLGLSLARSHYCCPCWWSGLFPSSCVFAHKQIQSDSVNEGMNEWMHSIKCDHVLSVLFFLCVRQSLTLLKQAQTHTVQLISKT